jgi:DNA-binding NarL/FixJ family response regulator
MAAANTKGVKLGTPICCLPALEQDTATSDLAERSAFFRQHWTPERLRMHFADKILKAACYLVDLTNGNETCGLCGGMAKGFKGSEIAVRLGVSNQTVTNAAHALADFTAQGWAQRN